MVAADLGELIPDSQARVSDYGQHISISRSSCLFVNSPIISIARIHRSGSQLKQDEAVLLLWRVKPVFNPTWDRL